MKRYSIILLISLFTALHAAAQLYPVRTITNVGAPYPLSLEQYGSFDNSRLQLTIIPNDIALQNYPVKLRLVISGGWFKIYTNPSFIHKEILLNNGETMTFTGADLAEWFNPDNLIFEGYSKAQYMKTGRLPEGVYQIWFEAWDLYRDFNISGTTKAMVFTLENEPPILNFPENKKELEPYDPQNIVFNWSFRQSPFSASGSSHQYRFELWEIDPDDMNAEEAVRVMRPIYTTEVNATTLNYTAAEPLLFKGKRYAWRIQVFDPMGTMRYKNDGYSQVFWFRFGKDIPVPVLSLDKTTTSSITVKWENDYRVTKYELRYRNKAKEGANWYTKDATGQSATIDNLEQNTPYEIQLHGYNGSQEGDYSESVTAKTNQDKAFACGAAPGATNTENTDPLSMLKSGDIFRASDFDIEVYRTSGANGTFTGRGFAMIPYLKFVKFEVEFNGIQINKDYRMTRGQVRFIYNENNGLVVNISKIIDDLKSHEPRVVEDNPYKKAADQKIVSNADITEVTVDENGVVTAKTSDGRTTQVRGSANGDMVAVSGGSDDSEQYVADTKNKTVYKGTPEKATNGKKPEQPASKTSGPTQYEVTFLPHILQQGGMDIPTNNSPAANYHQIQVGSKTIQVPWKSVESNKIDRIVAHIAGDPADTVRFLTKEGNLVMTAPGDKAFVSKSVQNTPSSGTFKQLLVTGREDEDELKAWYPEYEQVNDTTKKQNRILAGQVNIAAYDKITLDVCIVEVNGATVPETLPIEKELNEIYASSVVQWKVSRIKDFKVNIEGMQNGIFDNTDPNNDMDYTDHEKQVKEALKDHKDYNRKTLYLFFIGGKTKDNTLKGYMPFNKQFGFIFRENQQIQELIRTMAHELGHGAFRLRHIFSNKCPYPQTQGQTNNLMDYVDAGKALQALALHKYQWDEVHDFDLGLNWFESGDEGAMIGEPLVTFEWKTPPSSGTVTYITPSGLPISIKDATSCFIATEDNAGFSLDNDGVFDNTPEGKTFSFYTDKGPLFGFEKDNKKWFAIFSQSYFYGYYNKESKEYYTESTTENIAASPYITYVWESSGWTAKNCCLKITDYESIKLQNDPGYKGAGYFETDAINRPEATCYVPKAIEQLTEASFSELYVGEAWAKYNHFGDGGILYKVTLDGTNGYLYQNKDNKGNEYWLIYDKNAKHWKKFNYPGFRASDLLNLDFVGKIAQETGHTALDVIGVIPVIGEAADFINGVWYTVEGDALNASLCYASMIPIIGDAVFKGSKVVIKGIKSAGKAADIAKGLDKAINLTEQTSEVFVKIGKSLNAKSVANINECLYETGVLLTKHGDKAADLEKLLSAVPTEKLHAVLKKLNALEDGARVEFLTAIKYAENLPASHLAKNLDKIDEGVIGAWASLKNIGLDDALKCDIEKLDNLGSFAKRTGKSTDEIVADIAKYEDGPEQFLDELGSTSRSGHWDKNPFQRGRDIEDELGQNLPETFKTLDKYEKNTGEATSIKSLDLDAKTYQTTSKLRSRLNKYLDELDKFEGYSLEDVNIGKVLDGMPVNSKTLELAIPRAATGEQLNVINEIIANAASRVSSTSPNGINVKIVVK